MRPAGSPTVLFYVQHLLGIGHVFRATRVARALSRAGAQVFMAWGGTRLPTIDLSGLEMIWLDPVKADGAMFSGLVDPRGAPFGEERKAARRDALLRALDDIRPDIVITEAFPFGRRQMRFELEPFMEAARAAPWRPLTIASIRDIMQENRKESRVAESLNWFRRCYDLLLVHGDPSLIRIEETLQGADAILDKVRYSGLVTPDAPDLSQMPSHSADVVVSAGGGAVGHALTGAAIGANRHSVRFPSNWLLVVGPERDEAEFAALRQAAGEGMDVVRFVPDLARVLASAKVSVSRAGYNTVGDLLRAGCRCVLVPFAGGRETEQMRRAALLHARGVVAMLTDAELSPRALAEAVDRAATLLPLSADDLACDGADRSAEIVLAEYRSLRAG